MPTCSQCGETVELEAAFECNYCEQVHCANHRVPESHDCLYRAFLTSPWQDELDEASKYKPTVGRSEAGGSSASKRRGSSHASTRAEAMAKRKRNNEQSCRGSTDRRNERTRSSTAGKRHRDWEPESQPPDVAVDGAVAGEEASDLEATDVPTWPRIRRWVRLQLRTPFRAILRLAALDVVIGMAYLVFVRV